MPSPEKLQEYIELSEMCQHYTEVYRAAFKNFTECCSRLNHMLLDEYDYAGYIYRREAPPEWLRQLPNKTWIFREKKVVPEISRRTPKKTVDKTFEKLYNNMMGGFK